MKKTSLLIITFAIAFSMGFAFKSLITKQSKEINNMKRVTGIGGIFFKCNDPQKMNEWYKKHLGLNTNDYGAVFEWFQGADNSKKGFTQWSPFENDTQYFEYRFQTDSIG